MNIKLNHNRLIHDISDITFDDRAVGVLALITMYQVMTFLILQVLLFIPNVILLLLGETGTLDQQTANTLAIVLAILIELTLIVVLVRKGKKAFLKQMSLVREQETAAGAAKEEYVPPPLTEKQLEIAIGAAAVIAIGWGMLIGIGSSAIKIALTIIEGFALLFLITFMTVRFVTSREIRRTAVYCLALTALSLWILCQPS